jgi:hypothetical protein
VGREAGSSTAPSRRARLRRALRLMDLGAQLPVRDVLQRHGHLEKADLVTGLSCQDRRSATEASMLWTLSKVAAELAVSGVMHTDHRALSLTSIARPAGDARHVAEACQTHPDTPMDGSPGGIAPPGSHRTERDSLPSLRSSHLSPAQVRRTRLAHSSPPRQPTGASGCSREQTTK